MRVFLDKFNNRKDLREADLIKIQNILKLIIHFIFDLDSSVQINYFDIQLDPIQENQKLLKDMHVIDILIEIFYLTFTEYKIQDFNPRDKENRFYH